MLHKRIDITIAICTFNRAKYLDICLNSLFEQLKRYPSIEVLIIDNNSKDSTKSVYNKFLKKGMSIRYLLEQKQGLSHARNAAYDNSRASWIAYLDDDGIAHANYALRLLETALNFPCDCFGGMYFAYYENEKPKWISDNFGTKILIANNRRIIHEEFLSGGNFVCKREVLKKLGGFSTKLGMQGNKMGYSEEDEFQVKLRKEGYTIAFDPKLAINHLVAQYKLNPTWHISRTYCLNRDSIITHNPYATFYQLIKGIIKISWKYVPRFIYKFLKVKYYYWQHLYIDIFGNYARVLGLYRNRSNNLKHASL